MSNSPPFQQEPISLAEAFARYREVELPAQNKSETTRRGYLYDIAEWIRQLPEIGVHELDIGAIDGYLATLDRRGLKGTTRRRKVAAISHFLVVSPLNVHRLWNQDRGQQLSGGPNMIGETGSHGWGALLPTRLFCWIC